MTREEREDYRSWGKLHGTIISFFDGIDEQRAVFKENQNKKALQTTPTPDIDKKQDDGDDGEKANIQEFLEHIWELYDVDKNGFVDAEEASLAPSPSHPKKEYPEFGVAEIEGLLP